MKKGLKKVYNSKPASVVKSIFTGVGVLAVIAVIVAGVILLGPVILIAILSSVQFTAWVLVFCIVVLLPLWCIGKLWGWAFGKKKDSTTTSAEELAAEIEKLKQ